MGSEREGHEASDRRLRVAHVVQYLSVGGIERMVERMALAGPEHGLEVEVVAYLEDGPLRALLEARGVAVHLLPTSPGLSPRLPLRLARLLRRRRIDVVHSHHLGPFLYGGVAARLAGAAHVHTEHSVEFYDAPRRRAIGRAMSSLARVVCVAPEIARWRREQLGSDDLVIQNGVAVPPLDARARAAARDALGIGADRFVVGCVARLSAEKDHATLVDAFAALVASCPRAHLVLVGDGDRRGAIEERIRTAGLESKVSVLGRRLDTEAILPAFDVGALASVREGLPLSLLEVMATGAPVVATAVGGVPALLAEAGGVVVPPGDPAALGRALQLYADDADRRARDGAAARTLVQARYSDTEMNRRYAALYRQVARPARR
ncbi:MAG: glycosyltransferase [Deltaproteobacteria bacterium]|nr:glycosyltransferase [Deltaproteobacteria bacterium]MCB9788883.1 glycosyltransferase [Deltaproteobacteria bacterium]